MSIFIVDANVLIAASNTKETKHEEARNILEAIGAPYYVPVLVLAEVSYYLETKVHGDAELGLLKSIIQGDIIPVYFEDQWDDVLEYSLRYSDRQLGASDASVLCAAKRLATNRIVSMDQRDLSGLQLSEGRYVDLISYAHQI